MKFHYKHLKYLYLPLVLLLGALTMEYADHLFHRQDDYHAVDQFLIERAFQGVVLIAQEDKVLFTKGYGKANEELGIPNTAKTVFLLGSITKQFTAAAILRLQEQGKLDVNDPISRYLTEYPRGNDITIHHLLSHSSGIPSITDFTNLQEIQRHPSTPRKTMAYFQDMPLEFSPGTNCKYSDSGYIVLGAIIEEVTQSTYEDYIKESFFVPLGMTSTHYAHNHLIMPQRATGYEIAPSGKKRHSAYLDMSFPHAAGSLASTVEDLYQWDRALKTHSFLSVTSKDALFKIQASSRENQISYGYGFFIGHHNQELEKGSSTIVGHYGTIEGFRTASFRDLADDLTIIVLSNVENTDINSIHLKIAHLVRDSWRCRAKS